MNGTMMQYFEWYLPNNGELWKKVADDAPHLKALGITSVWLPPAYKGAEGINDVGYSPYDFYDLGEFDQKGSVSTKYGTLEDYLAAIKSFHDNDINVYADIVLDHMMGADETEEVVAKKQSEEDRNEDVGKQEKIKAWTRFTFPGRGHQYSDFRWDWTRFTGTDRDEKRCDEGIYRFKGKEWADDVDTEFGNFDYLMGSDIDLQNPEVIAEMVAWGKWVVKKTKVDGFRLDAVKHIDFNFFTEWLDKLREDLGREFFAVGEYWSGDLNDLKNFMEISEGVMSLFDVPLHFAFYDAGKAGGQYDLRTIMERTMTAVDPVKSVTFVDNHDTQPGQSLESFVEEWFKPQAYGFILLRAQGYPCIFYGDYYGIPHNDYHGIRELLDKLLYVRKALAYGEQRDYFEHPGYIGWLREGIDEFPNSGIATLISSGEGGTIVMEMGERNANKTYYDIIKGGDERVTTDEHGVGHFYVGNGSLAVWVDAKTLEEE